MYYVTSKEHLLVGLVGIDVDVTRYYKDEPSCSRWKDRDSYVMVLVATRERPNFASGEVYG